MIRTNFNVDGMLYGKWFLMPKLLTCPHPLLLSADFTVGAIKVELFPLHISHLLVPVKFTRQNAKAEKSRCSDCLLKKCIEKVYSEQ